MTKTVPLSKFQEWEGLDRIATAVHAMHCIFREITKDDVGLDGEIEVLVPSQDGKGYEVTGGIIKVQAKSGASYIKQDSPTGFVTPVEPDHLNQWSKSNFPVAFIVYHPADGKLYWKEVRSYTRNTPAVFQRPTRIVFDKRTDEFPVSTYPQLLELAKGSPPRVNFASHERLFTNLLRVQQLPAEVSRARTSFTSYTQLRTQAIGFLPPVTVIGDYLYTLDDLAQPQCRLREYCCADSVEKLSVGAWLRDPTHRTEFVFLLNQLLGIHLRDCGLVYTREYRRNYFPRRDDTSLQFKQGWYNVRTNRRAQPRTVARYYEYGSDKFWRHLAASIAFREIGRNWFLQVIPRYFYTVDGVQPWDNSKVGPYTTSQKAHERNIHVLNHVLFWADVLSRGQPRIEMTCASRVLLVASKEPMTGIAHFAIPSDPAVYEDAEEILQPNLFDLIPEQATAEDEDEY